LTGDYSNRALGEVSGWAISFWWVIGRSCF